MGQMNAFLLYVASYLQKTPGAALSRGSEVLSSITLDELWKDALSSGSLEGLIHGEPGSDGNFVERCYSRADHLAGTTSHYSGIVPDILLKLRASSDQNETSSSHHVENVDISDSKKSAAAADIKLHSQGPKDPPTRSKTTFKTKLPKGKRLVFKTTLSTDSTPDAVAGKTSAAGTIQGETHQSRSSNPPMSDIKNESTAVGSSEPKHEGKASAAAGSEKLDECKRSIKKRDGEETTCGKSPTAQHGYCERCLRMATVKKAIKKENNPSPMPEKKAAPRGKSSQSADRDPNATVCKGVFNRGKDNERRCKRLTTAKHGYCSTCDSKSYNMLEIEGSAISKNLIAEEGIPKPAVMGKDTVDARPLKRMGGFERIEGIPYFLRWKKKWVCHPRNDQTLIVCAKWENYTFVPVSNEEKEDLEREEGVSVVTELPPELEKATKPTRAK